MLLSVERRAIQRGCDVLVFDLGLTASARDDLARRFAWCDVRAFDFDAHPPHVRDLTTFAWKPLAVSRVVDERGGPILWLDSGTLFHAPPDPIFETRESEPSAWSESIEIESSPALTAKNACCDLS